MKTAVNIAIITLDSLRYDTTQIADTPNLDALIKKHQRYKGKWIKVGAQATYTLPAHVSLFHSGFLPTDKSSGVPAPFNRAKINMFRAQLPWARNKPAIYPTPEATSIVKGFSKLGYRTLGIGGVGWFNTKFLTSNLWDNYFDEFYWQENFSENDFHSFENQIAFARTLSLKDGDKQLYFFLNVSCTHSPFMGFGKSIEAQAKCLEYVDLHINSLLDLLPRPLQLLIMSDHGECFGEDDKWGHGFYHPKIMEIPMASLEIDIKKGFIDKIKEWV